MAIVHAVWYATNYLAPSRGQHHSPSEARIAGIDQQVEVGHRPLSDAGIHCPRQRGTFEQHHADAGAMQHAQRLTQPRLEVQHREIRYQGDSAHLIEHGCREGVTNQGSETRKNHRHRTLELSEAKEPRPVDVAACRDANGIVIGDAACGEQQQFFFRPHDREASRQRVRDSNRAVVVARPRDGGHAARISVRSHVGKSIIDCRAPGTRR